MEWERERRGGEEEESRGKERGGLWLSLCDNEKTTRNREDRARIRVFVVFPTERPRSSKDNKRRRPCHQQVATFS
jgi:hypothetical protein